MPEATVTTKPFYQSVTIWVNAVTVFGIVIPLITAYLGFLSDLQFVGERTALLIGTTLGLINGVLGVIIRVYLTGSPISGTPVAQAGQNPPPPGDSPG